MRSFRPTARRSPFEYKPKTSPVTDIALLDWNSRQVKKLTNEQSKDHLWQLDTWTHDGKYVIAASRECRL